jgi:DNA polymerase-3 subunit epsilon
MESPNINLFNTLTTQLPIKEGRYIVLDTETTGLDVNEDKLINISAVEIINGNITGFQFNATLRKRNTTTKKNNKHYYMNDYTTESPYDFEKLTMQSFLRFIGDSFIFAHNANFDSQFLNQELKLWQLEEIKLDRFICTMKLARTFSGKPLTLDKFCKYYKIETNAEDFHYAIYDAFMLARIVCKIYGEYDRIKEEVRQNELLSETIIPMELTLMDFSISDKPEKDMRKMKNLMKNMLLNKS